jgi:16S rRNA (guanine966-N2)-methyltransferase
LQEVGFWGLNRYQGVPVMSHLLSQTRGLRTRFKKISSGHVLCNDALVWINSQSLPAKKYDVVFLDPPFSSNILGATCQHLDSSSLLNQACKIYIETGIDPNNLTFPQDWRRLKLKKAGQVFSSLFIKD